MRHPMSVALLRCVSQGAHRSRPTPRSPHTRPRVGWVWCPPLPRPACPSKQSRVPRVFQGSTARACRPLHFHGCWGGDVRDAFFKLRVGTRFFYNRVLNCFPRLFGTRPDVITRSTWVDTRSTWTPGPRGHQVHVDIRSTWTPGPRGHQVHVDTWSMWTAGPRGH